MKILSIGKIPEPPPNWWTSLPMTCGTCKTVVQLEDGDKPRFILGDRPLGKGIVEIDCPTCGNPIEHNESPMREAAMLKETPPAQ